VFAGRPQNPLSQPGHFGKASNEGVRRGKSRPKSQLSRSLGVPVSFRFTTRSAKDFLTLSHLDAGRSNGISRFSCRLQRPEDVAEAHRRTAASGTLRFAKIREGPPQFDRRDEVRHAFRMRVEWWPGSG